ncbi:MAG: hypothetical protein A2Z20_00755 [Bdellovibrionales bacterium RBG_16_40_8]|nr:MAG: hypothetical protein A2Z20_00755 [Bdellovibrionales bacterium RBG_16_40_8]
MNNKFRFNMALLICAFVSLLSARALASGTVVGNGGDPVFEFMEAARTSMIETIKVIINDPSESAHFCENPKLNADQIKFCRDFFIAIAPDILRLSQGLTKTFFVLRDQPLFVEGPDGIPMVVAARTELGPMGPIELHRESVKTLLPTQVLFLMTHEFQHKADFFGRIITDNEMIAPFATGRDLIDTVAAAVVVVARKKGKVGSQFGIRDIFDCRAFANQSQFGARLSSSRLFQAEDLMSYETSIGKNPTDGSIFLPETIDSSLLLRFVINEPNNCGDPSPKRKSIIQIVRSVKLVNGSQDETVVADQELTENPMCPGSSRQIEISKDEVRFVCNYFGSEGTTSSQFSLNSLIRPNRTERGDLTPVTLGFQSTPVIGKHP